MFDFAEARRFMIEGQIRTNEVTVPGIVNGMLDLPRENFVPKAYRTLAYSDREIEVAPGREILTPMTLGKLLVAADIQDDEIVLDVGCATGYGAALLARLAQSVVALEENADLARQASENLAALDVQNVAVVVGPLAAGHAAEAPYDVILIEGSVELVPDALAAQLKPEGRLVVVYGRGRSARGTVFRATRNGLSGFPLFDAAAPVLPGFVQPPSFVF